MTPAATRPRAIRGANLWAIREDDLRMTRAQLAESLGISPAFLWKIENDKAQPSPTIRGQIVDRLADLTNTSRETVIARLIAAEQVAA
jgi:DNA-binding XRE family transcriptional regulator